MTSTGRVTTVLLVEDETDQRHLFAMELKHSGFDLTCVTSVREAVDALRSHPRFDALVADLALPDGDATVALAAAAEKRPRVALLVTGMPISVRPQPLGFDRAFTKPVSPREIAEHIVRALDAQRDVA